MQNSTGRIRNADGQSYRHIRSRSKQTKTLVIMFFNGPGYLEDVSYGFRAEQNRDPTRIGHEKAGCEGAKSVISVTRAIDLQCSRIPSVFREAHADCRKGLDALSERQTVLSIEM